MNPKTEIKRKWAATECIIIDPHQIIKMVQYPHIIAESNLKQSETQIFFLYIWFWRFESFDETEKKTIAWDIWSHLYLNFIATHIYLFTFNLYFLFSLQYFKWRMPYDTGIESTIGHGFHEYERSAIVSKITSSKGSKINPKYRHHSQFSSSSNSKCELNICVINIRNTCMTQNNWTAQNKRWTLS